MNRQLPLDTWAAKKIGAGGTVTRELISRYQVRKLRETISLAYQQSLFYRQLLQGKLTVIVKAERCGDFLTPNAAKRTIAELEC